MKQEEGFILVVGLCLAGIAGYVVQVLLREILDVVEARRKSREQQQESSRGSPSTDFLKVAQSEVSARGRQQENLIEDSQVVLETKRQRRFEDLEKRAKRLGIENFRSTPGLEVGGSKEFDKWLDEQERMLNKKQAELQDKLRRAKEALIRKHEEVEGRRKKFELERSHQHSESPKMAPQRQKTLKEQQDEAFLASLSKDQEKALQEALLEERKREVRERRIIVENRRRVLLAALGNEPKQSDSGVIGVAIRLPDGRQISRRFIGSASVRDVMAFAAGNLVGSSFLEKFGLVSAYPRRKLASTDDMVNVGDKEEGNARKNLDTPLSQFTEGHHTLALFVERL